VVLSDYYDLGFDLRSRVLVFGFKDGKKTVTQTHGNLVAHLCAHERGETRGGFAHQHSRVLAFDIDSAQLELTPVDHILEFLGGYGLLPCLTEVKTWGSGLHIYVRFDSIVSDYMVKRFRAAMKAAGYQIDVRTTTVGLRFPGSRDYVVTRYDNTVEIKKLYDFVNTYLDTGELWYNYGEKKDCVITRGNRVGPMISMGFQYDDLNEYIRAVIRCNQGSRDIELWLRENRLHKECERIWLWCRKHYRSRPTGFVSNASYVSVREKRWLRRVARHRGYQYRRGKTRARMTTALYDLLVEYLGYARYRQLHPHRTNPGYPISYQKRVALETGICIGHVFTQKVLDHYGHRAPVSLHDDVVAELFQQFSHNTQGWTWGQVTRQYILCLPLITKYRYISGVHSEKLEHKPDLIGVDTAEHHESRLWINTISWKRFLN